MSFAGKTVKAGALSSSTMAPASAAPRRVLPSRRESPPPGASFSFAETSVDAPPGSRPGDSMGLPLPQGQQARGRKVFGGSFADVFVHADGPAAAAAHRLSARAFTIDRHVFFGANQYRPEEPSGLHLLGHELAHVAQQRLGHARADERHEREADRAGVAYVLGQPARIDAFAGGGAGPVLQRSPLSERVDAMWASAPNKGRVFDVLRAAAQPDAARDTELRNVLQRIFAGQPDDLWLAERIRSFGPEPLWPAAELNERGRLAREHSWPAERGNIEGSFPVPGRLPVRAFYFRGQTDRRAMVISGVHGSEVSGVEVVERLLDRLRQPGAPMPYYTLIVVPRLFPDRVAAELARTRRPGTNSNDFRESGEFENNAEIPTNRNFPSPAPGATPDQARHAAAAATADAQARPQRILAQNRILLGLIDRFQPERIASVHANRRATGIARGGPGHGVFVDPAHPSRTSTAADPRVEDANADRDHPRTAEDRLAADMARVVVDRGGRAAGNFVGQATGAGPRPVGQTRYDPRSTLHNDGVSLGVLGPAIGATVVTVEVPWYEGSASYAPGADREQRLRELDAYAISLEEVFLGPGDAAASAF